MAWPEFTSFVNPLATHMLGESVAVEIQARGNWRRNRKDWSLTTTPCFRLGIEALPGGGFEIRMKSAVGRNTKCAVDLANGHRRGSGGYDRSGGERVAVR